MFDQLKTEEIRLIETKPEESAAIRARLAEVRKKDEKDMPKINSRLIRARFSC